GYTALPAWPRWLRAARGNTSWEPSLCPRLEIQTLTSVEVPTILTAGAYRQRLARIAVSLALLAAFRRNSSSTFWSGTARSHFFMTWLSTIVIAFAMSTDAFAAAVSKGACLTRPRFSEALRTGAIFGFIEAMTPLIGWGLGTVAAPYVQAWDHWIAFTVLGVLGLHMVHNGWKGEEDEDTATRSRHSFWLLA